MRPPPGRPWVIAHRGASAACPENTAAAFRAAAGLGADAVELDVRRTADGAAVVHHDAVVPGVGPVVAATRDALRRHAPWLPGLGEALAACGPLWVNVEVKNSPAEPDWDPGRALAASVVAHLDAAGRLGESLVTSFDPGVLERARALAPALATGWLVEMGAPPAPALQKAVASGWEVLLPAASALAGAAGPEMVAAAHQAGLRLVCWTLDDPAEARRLAAAGIDGIITNRPELICRAVSGGRR